MTHRLLVNPGTPQAWEISLKPGVNRIGRSEQNDFQVTHASVSGAHCEIVLSSAGVVLRDLGSTNGTFVNRSPVREITLQPGQHVQLGSVDMIFEAPTQAMPVTATAASVPIGVAPPAPPPPPPPVTARPTGLRLSGAHAPVQAEATATSSTELIGQPPLPPPVTPPMQVGGAYCKFHPKTLARFYCGKCQKYFCDMCVSTGAVKTCRACGVGVSQIEVRLQRPAAAKGFFARIPDSFIYPFRGMGFFMLIALTLIFVAIKGCGLLAMSGGVRGPAIGLIGTVLAMGYLFAYMQTVIHTTAAEDKEMPELIGISNLWEDILIPCLQLIAMTVLCFGAAIGLSIATVVTESPTLGILTIPAWIVGLIYFPMAFLAVVILDSVTAANPLVVIPSILRVPGQYVVTLAILGALVFLSWIGDIITVVMFPRGWVTHSMAELFTMIVVQVAWAVGKSYLLTVNIRVLGELYVSQKEKLGWLNR